MKKVLVIEDDSDIRNGLIEILTLEGFGVDSAQDGQKGIDFLRNSKKLPDVIILDLLMPIKDGYQFRTEQLADRRLSEIPVVVITANRLEEGKTLGTNGFLRKPVSIDELLDVIHKVVN